MFSYILVDFTGYILLISICLMLKARKMNNIASQVAVLYLQIDLAVLYCVGVLNSRNGEQIFKQNRIAIQEKENEICIYTN